MTPSTPEEPSKKSRGWKLKIPDEAHLQGIVDRAAGMIVTLLLIAGGAAVVFYHEAIFAPKVGWLDGQIFWVLALVPSIVAIVNYWVAERRRYSRGIDELKSRQAEVQKVSERDCRANDEPASNISKQPKQPKQEAVTQRLAMGIEDGRRPVFAYTLLGAGLLAIVFGIAAQLSSRSPECGEYGIGPKVPCELVACDDCAPRSASEAEPKADPRNDQPQRGGMREAILALVFASYGAYAYTLRAMIGRLNASALSGRFLVRVAMQSAGTVVLGFVIGYVGAAGVVATEHQSLFLYFLIGMFPAWATQLIAGRTREIFQTPEAGCERLPLCLIDGIDEDVTDRLSEVNVWDIQHLATSDPVDLTLRTQYPLDRILDWIDQAILVSYVRSDITHFRALGLRGAIDFAILASDNVAPEREQQGSQPRSPSEERANEMRRHEAAEVFRLIPELTKVKRPALLAQALFEDAAVDFVWRLWQRTRP